MKGVLSDVRKVNFEGKNVHHADKNFHSGNQRKKQKIETAKTRLRFIIDCLGMKWVCWSDYGARTDNVMMTSPDDVLPHHRVDYKTVKNVLDANDKKKVTPEKLCN